MKKIHLTKSETGCDECNAIPALAISAPGDYQSKRHYVILCREHFTELVKRINKRLETLGEPIK